MECKGCGFADINGLCAWPDNHGGRPCETEKETGTAAGDTRFFDGHERNGVKKDGGEEDHG